jgi:hypothetical protein
MDNKNKKVFAGECKYHAKPVDVGVYFDLQQKIKNCGELAKTYKDYQYDYGVFSKSGFTKRMLELAELNSELYLVNECAVV